MTDYLDEPPPEVRLEICKRRRAHLYPPTSGPTTFRRTPDGHYERRVTCTSCGIAQRIEVWDLEINAMGKVTSADLLTLYPGVVEPDPPGGRVTRADLKRATS